MRRRLGKRIQEPIEILAESRHVDSITFVETDNEAAKLTRAAALMFIHRRGYDLCTSVKENEIYILKNKDIAGMNRRYDLT